MGGYVSLGADFAPNDYNRYAEVFKSEKYIPFQKRGDDFSKLLEILSMDFITLYLISFYLKY